MLSPSVCVGKQFSEKRRILGVRHWLAGGRASFFAERRAIICAMYSPLLITTNFIRHRARLGFVFIVRACGIDAVAAAAVPPFVNELEFRISAHPLLLTLFSSA